MHEQIIFFRTLFLNTKYTKNIKKSIFPKNDYVKAIHAKRYFFVLYNFFRLRIPATCLGTERMVGPPTPFY